MIEYTERREYRVTSTVGLDELANLLVCVPCGKPGSVVVYITPESEAAILKQAELDQYVGSVDVVGGCVVRVLGTVIVVIPK